MYGMSGDLDRSVALSAMLMKPSHILSVLSITAIHGLLLALFEVVHFAFDNRPAARENARLEGAAQDDSLIHIYPHSI
jgi:hypothetical protein